jgi:transmembrane serine protease 11D
MKKLHLSLSLFLVVGLFLVATVTVKTQAPTPSSTQSQPTVTPLPTEIPLKPQIVGGQPADPAEYPWQVALVQAGEPDPLTGQFCGGSLIHPEWILTAAHCVVDLGIVIDPAGIEVVLGINNLSDGLTSGTEGQRLAVAEVIPFPNYDLFTDDGDVALLRLATPATLDSTVSTLGLVGPEHSALLEPGDTATVTGWGATSSGGPGSNALLEVAVPIVSNATCNAPSSYGGAVTGKMLCAGLSAGGLDSILFK